MTETQTLPPPDGLLENINKAEFDLTAYAIVDDSAWVIEPAPAGRDWMDANHGHASKCLPITIANVAGWVIRSPVTFTATWQGGTHKGSTGFVFSDPYERFTSAITDHFGQGIITFNLPWLFKTSRPGVGLRVCGLPNDPRFNVTALEGYVETDWLPFTFTMNWKISKPGVPVTFAKGDPVCFITPATLDFVEAARPVVKRLDDDPEVAAAYREWDDLRRKFNADPTRASGDWQKFYHGSGGLACPPETHRTALKVRPF